MTHSEFISLVQHPQAVSAEHLADLKELVERYPYFAVPRLMETKVLEQTKSIHFGANMQSTAIYSPSREWLYYFLYPEKKQTTVNRKERSGKSAGNYFDMMEMVERDGGDTKSSLKGLAERLRAARQMVLETPKPQVIVDPQKLETMLLVESAAQIEKTSSQNISIAIDNDFSEETAKKLIKEKKYMQAIAILKTLNLNNPKKSVYFADQIRFLEKVLENSKK